MLSDSPSQVASLLTLQHRAATRFYLMVQIVPFVSLRESTPGSFSAAVDASVRKANTATNYAQQCYNFSNYGGCSAGSPCNSFVVPRLALSQDTNAPCPFSDGICRNESSNIILDTGYIDSHDHLGINSPEKNRLLSRTVAHCAPLRTEGYKTNIQENFPAYYYGLRYLPRDSPVDPNSKMNYTLKVPSVTSQNLQLGDWEHGIGSPPSLM